MRIEARRVERLARRDRDPRSSSSASAKSSDVRKPSARQHVADVDEHVERAGRLAAAQPRIGGQPLVQLIAPLPVLVEHRRHRRLRSDQRRDHRLLRDRGDVRRRVALDRVRRGDHRRRADRPSRSASRSSRRPSTPIRRAPPARGTSPPARPAGCAAPGRRSASRSRDRRPARCSAARRTRRSSRSSRFGDQRAGRIARRVDDDAARARRDRVENRLRANREAVLGVRAHEDRRRVGQLDLLGNRRPVRRVRDHLVARAEQRQRRVVERLLAAGGDDDLGLLVVDAVVGPVAIADRRFRSAMPATGV